MSKLADRNPLTRRDFLKIGGGLLGAAAGSTLLSRAFLHPAEVARAAKGFGSLVSSAGQAPAAQLELPTNMHVVGTDGWIYLPTDAPVPPYHPDNLAPAPFTTYIFGFRDVTPVMADSTLVHAQKMKAQLTAPLFWIEQETDFVLKLTNLGLQIRPDLVDSHTIHFHGFRNAIPIFDGEPHSSVGVPINRELTYFYHPHDPGTYMWHCHFEETEHIHMGMVGPVFITPIQNYGTLTIPAARLGGALTGPRGYVYNDGDGSTAYDREFVLVMSEVWLESHWCDSHVQLPEWSDYRPQFYVINGRSYPDTLLPNGEGTDPVTGDLLPPLDPIDPINNPPIERLKYQPLTSLIQAKEGERVLLRLINLGFEQQSMKLDGIKLHVVGKDAVLLRSTTGNDLSYYTSTVTISPGETVEAIFEAPTHSGAGGPDHYLFYNRNFHRLSNGGHNGYGGQMTEVRVFSAASSLPDQTTPNT